MTVSTKNAHINCQRYQTQGVPPVLQMQVQFPSFFNSQNITLSAFPNTALRNAQTPLGFVEIAMLLL